MPIRITKDPNKGKTRGGKKLSKSNGGRSFSGGGGASQLGALLPVVMGLFKKNPKILIVLVIVAVGAYFLFGQKACSGLPTNPTSNEGGNPVTNMISQFFTGGKLDPQEYQKAEIFEPLVDNAKNPLPEKYSLIEYAPKRLNQGKQGSCVGWASAYAARTILEAKATGKNPNEIAYSPSFLYNQIALENCQGSYLIEACKTMNNVGGLSMREFPYTESSCAKSPTSSQRSRAKQHTIRGYNRLSEDARSGQVDLLAIKQNLSQGSPVIIGMMVGGSFMKKMMGKSEWIPNKSDFAQKGFGGHAMCVIGYDDYKFGDKDGLGFQIMNSWGEKWGDKGVFWIRYDHFQHFTREAYGLYPMGDSKAVASKFEAEVGLIDNKSNRPIELEKVEQGWFKTKRPIQVGTRFKIESTNSIECYTYVFGMETDGSSYTLFPNTPKHSPYCGIVGTRRWPRHDSFEADNIGDKDFMAVVLTKKPIDYNLINDKINQAPGNSYYEKLRNAFGVDLVTNANYSGGNKISVNTSVNGKNAVVLAIEVDKY